MKCDDSVAKTVGGFNISAITAGLHVYGLTYDGNRANRTPGTPVGTSHGIRMYNVKKSSLHDVTVKNCMADGIYIDASDQADTATNCEEVYFYNVEADNCYRNGWSIVSGKHIRGYGCRGINTTGTAPQAGIDFEADSGVTTKPDDIIFYDFLADSNAGAGITFSRNAFNCKIIGGTTRDNTSHGVDWAEGAEERCSVYGLHAEGNGDDNFSLRGYKHQIIGCTSKNSTNKHIDSLANTYHCTIAGFEGEAGKGGAEIRGTNHQISDLKIRDCTDATLWHLYVARSDHRINNVEIYGSGGAACQGFEDASIGGCHFTNISVENCKDFSGTREVKLAGNHRFVRGVWDDSQGYPSEDYVRALDDTGTPSVLGGKQFVTGGTTTITDFDDGIVGQRIVVRSVHSVTVSHNANISLNGAANFAMTSGDVLVLERLTATKWYEVGRSDV